MYHLYKYEVNEYLRCQEQKVTDDQPGPRTQWQPPDRPRKIQYSGQKIEQGRYDPSQHNDPPAYVIIPDKIIGMLYQQAYHEQEIADKRKPGKKNGEAHGGVKSKSLKSKVRR
jgi:hypothetical protein